MDAKERDRSFSLMAIDEVGGAVASIKRLLALTEGSLSRGVYSPLLPSLGRLHV